MHHAASCFQCKDVLLQPERYNGAKSHPKIASKHKNHSDGAMPYCEGRRKSLPARISGRYTALATYKDEIHIVLFALNHDENVEKQRAKHINNPTNCVMKTQALFLSELKPMTLRLPSWQRNLGCYVCATHPGVHASISRLVQKT